MHHKKIHFVRVLFAIYWRTLANPNYKWYTIEIWNSTCILITAIWFALNFIQKFYIGHISVSSLILNCIVVYLREFLIFVKDRNVCQMVDNLIPINEV